MFLIIPFLPLFVMMCISLLIHFFIADNTYIHTARYLVLYTATGDRPDVAADQYMYITELVTIHLREAHNTLTTS